jgi:hypothetical protein
MCLDLGQNGGERANPQRAVPWHGDMVLAAARGGEAEVTAGLSGGLIAKFCQRFGQIVAAGNLMPR